MLQILLISAQRAVLIRLCISYCLEELTQSVMVCEFKRSSKVYASYHQLSMIIKQNMWEIPVVNSFRTVVIACHATSPGVWGTHLPHWFYKQGYRRFYFYRSLEKGVKPFKNLRLIKFLILCISLNIWKIKLTIPYSKGSTQWNGLHCTIWTKKNTFAIDLISFPKSLTSSFHFSTFSHFRILEVHKI